MEMVEAVHEHLRVVQETTNVLLIEYTSYFLGEAAIFIYLPLLFNFI